MKHLSTVKRVFDFLIIAYALAQIVLLLYIWQNHIAFPLNLEAMELYVLTHVKRIVSGLPIYIEPNAEFIPFVYNPLYYFLSIPFVKLFGPTLQALRLASITGAIGVLIVLFLSVRRLTGSVWWGIAALGIFAASYHAMSSYLDTAHADSWLLFMVLLGCYLIDLRRSKLVSSLGVVALILAFWFKQHGALFLLGALLYLTWREKIANSWLYWLLAAIFGVGLYIYYPVSLLGPYFHYYTWVVPRQWSELNFATLYRIVAYVLKNFPFLSIIGALAWTNVVYRERDKLNIWIFLFPVAVLSGLMGALDPENNNNVFIPMATWLILMGILELAKIRKKEKASHVLLPLGVRIVVLLSFGFLFYHPTLVMVSAESRAQYEDLKQFLSSLDGIVYAPWIGASLQDGYQFYPTIHWVPLYDLIRGPNANVPDHALPRQLLESVTHPSGNAFILMNYPLENDNMLGFLTDYYVLAQDLGNRFSALSTLPMRYNLKYPRYLYKYDPAKADD